MKTKYHNANRLVGKNIKEAQEERIEKPKRFHNNVGIKKAYTILNKLTKACQLKVIVIKHTNGNVLTVSAAVLNRWTKYYSGT
ncbi:hypothetical protein DPMN_181248 [Dreissena polymorpha]|uniref:Uncharacterized protein n=1 Tax=Dreissena polymorpha TaxID=45954 RepID=A0A9D4I1F1_DREPO|nr:hypothetical protein DPMN_181248 [Dreissena polymorpha]